MTMMMVIGMIDNDSGGFSIVVQCKAVAISHVYITFSKISTIRNPVSLYSLGTFQHFAIQINNIGSSLMDEGVGFS